MASVGPVCPGASSDVLVRGRPNVLQIAGEDGGTKLLDIKRLAKKGHAVKVIGEKQLWKLVQRATPPRKGGRRVKGTRRG